MESLDHMHAKGIAHRDLKLENLLLDQDFNLKVADFGFATAQYINQSYKGTPGYMPYEVINEQEYVNEKVDIFTTGVILFIVLTKGQPFYDAKPSDGFYQHIANGDPASFWQAHMEGRELPEDHFSVELRDLISALLDMDPERRPTAAEVLSHPWM